MAASYVIVTAAAVIVVEAAVIAITIPGLLADQDLITRVRDTAGTYADAVASASTSSSQLTLPSDFVVGQPNLSLGPGKVQPQGSGLVHATGHASQTGNRRAGDGLVSAPSTKRTNDLSQ